jgi:copper chaperone
VDDRAAEFADALERRRQVLDGEVRKGSGIAGTGSTIVDSEAQVVGVGLPTRSGLSGPWQERDPEDSEPEPPRAIGIVGWEFDQWSGHGRKYGRQFVLADRHDRPPLVPHGRRNLPATGSAPIKANGSRHGMSCDDSGASVTEEVQQVDGVTAVVVDLEAGRVTVQGQGFSGEALRAAVDEAGYEVVGA